MFKIVNYIVLVLSILLTSCFKSGPLESSDRIPIDSLSHYYSIDLKESDSIVHISFASWPIADRNKRLRIPEADKIQIDGKVLERVNNSYKLKIPVQNIKKNLITISYLKSDTVFYTKRILLTRFNTCKVIFNQSIQNDIDVYFEPALNMLEELSVELKGEKMLYKRFPYSESIQNGISFNKNLGLNYGKQNKRVPVIRLKKLYTEKATFPVNIWIETSTEIEKEIRYVPEFNL